MATRRRDDDSSEDEATAIDFRSTPSSMKKSPPKTNAPGPPKSKVSKIASEPLHKSDLDSDDEEATEFLAPRPPSVSIASEPSNSMAQPRARGRAVPLGDGEEAVVSENRGVSRQSLVAAAKAEQPITTPLTSPDNMEQLPRAPRPLPGRITNVKSELDSTTGTPSIGAKSTPRITRIFVDPTGTHKKVDPREDIVSETDPGASERTDPPELQKVRPLPAPGKPPTVVASPSSASNNTEKRNRPKTVKVASEPTSETLEADPADGTLIVEVPEGAVVFLDGIERGKGPSLKLKEIDRYAKHAVRIHCAGYLPWSGSVCLEGRTAAKIRPGLKKREK
jgi:hypothetical protein